MFEFSCPSLLWFPGPSHHTSAFGTPPSQEQDIIRYWLSLVTLKKHIGSAGGISVEEGIYNNMNSKSFLSTFL